MLHVHKDSNVDDIFRLLIATFSGTKSYTEVQKKFYERRQNPEESIRDFLYALNELMQETEQVKPESVHDREDDQLCWKLVTHKWKLVIISDGLEFSVINGITL